jgi:hypothetical protein
VLAAEKLLHSKLLVPRANKWIGSADTHIGVVRGFCSPTSVQKLTDTFRSLLDYLRMEDK